MLQMYFITIAQQAGTFENVTQFTHVARVWVATQPVGRLR